MSTIGGNLIDGLVERLLNILSKPEDRDEVSLLLEKLQEMKKLLGNDISPIDPLIENVRKVDKTSMTVQNIPKSFYDELKKLKEAVVDEKETEIVKRVESIIEDLTAPEGGTSQRKAYQYFDTESDYKDSYENVPILPTEKDFNDFRPILKPNIIDGPYKDAAHYLETHFRLLREDFVYAMRRAVRQFRKVRNSKIGITDSSLKHIRDAHVYLNLTVNPGDLRVGKISPVGILNLKMPPSYLYGIDWQNSTRLQGGTFVSISSDHFQTFTHAVVVEYRASRRLQNGLVRLKYLNSDGLSTLSLRRPMTLIENSSAYYEAYAHTLQVLRNMIPETLPFTNYLVNLEDDQVRPSFLGGSLNFSPLNTSEFGDPSVWKREQSEILKARSITWPEQGDTILNAQQYAAVLNAFNNELCVIQGPPGTGKTFVAKKVVELQLLNKVTDKPILVVCYTNHALDQFLEGISKFTDKIKRFGGSSKNEAVAKYVVTNILVRTDQALLYGTCMNKIRHYIGVLRNEELLNEDEHELGVSNSELYKMMHLRKLMRQKRDLRKSTKLIDGNFLRDLDRGQDELPNDPDAMEYSDPLNDLKSEVIRGKLSEPLTAGKIPSKNQFRSLPVNWRWMLYRQIHDTFVRNFVNIYIQKCFGTLKASSIFASSSTVAEILRLQKFNCKDTSIECLRTRYEELDERLRSERAANEKAAVAAKLKEVKGCEVIGMTTSGAAKNRQFIEQLQPEIVIVEEAAEVLEAHILACLTPGTKQLILIGDHQQLQPATAVYRLATDFNLQISMFERLVRNKISFVKLEEQHRMQDEIRKLLVPTIYKEYHSHKNVFTYPNVRGMTSNLYFVNHDHVENVNLETLSKTNVFEAELLINLAVYFMKIGYESKGITILATYRGQVELMIKKMTEYCESIGLFLDEEEAKETGWIFPEPFNDLRITTVDNYQGEENTIVLVSLVRSNVDGKIGFLSRDNRICVALSRAKHGLYCVGNLDLLSSVSPTWAAIMETIKEGGRVGKGFELHCPRHDGKVLMTNGEEVEGCGAPCNTPLSSGHRCPLPCHFGGHKDDDSAAERIHGGNKSSDEIKPPCIHDNFLEKIDCECFKKALEKSVHKTFENDFAKLSV